MGNLSLLTRDSAKIRPSAGGKRTLYAVGRRFHLERAHARRPRSSVPRSGRIDRSVSPRPGALPRAAADRRRPRGRRRLYGRRLCARKRAFRRGAGNRRSGPVQHGDGRRRREDGFVACPHHERRSAGRDGGARGIPGREPGDARRHRRDEAAHAALHDRGERSQSQSLASICADIDVVKAAGAGSSVADARCSYRGLHGRVQAACPPISTGSPRSASRRRAPR